MKNTDLLTIAMPVYERKDYFLAALESALNQTVKCEVIVVDNCSSHTYFEDVCKKKNVRYFRNEKNIGLFPNWNKCFEHASTDYVMVFGDDDLLAPNYVESFLKAKEANPAIDIYFSDFSLNNLTTGEQISHKHILPFGYMENGTKVIEYGIKYRLGFPLITSAVRRSIFTGYYSKFHASNDWLWIYSNADNLVFFGDTQKLAKYGIHVQQDSRQARPNCMLSIAYIYEEVLREKVSQKELKKKVDHNTFWTLIRLKAGATKQLLKDFMNSNTMYSEYLNYKLKKNKLISTIFILPRGVVDLFYRSMRKIGVTG